MSRDKSTVKNNIEQWKCSSLTNKAVNVQKWIDFHCHSYLDKNDLIIGGHYASWVRDVVKSILPNEKHDMFLSMLIPPLKTVNFTDDIFDEIGRVLESANYSRNIKSDGGDASEFNDFLISSGIGRYWRKDVINRLKTDINSIVVCDLPSDGGDPYYYFVSPDRVKYIEYDEIKGDIKEIYFVQNYASGKKNIHVYDKFGFSVYDYKDSKLGARISNNDHKLGYCPASWFWDKVLNSENVFIREFPLAKDLGNLDWLLFYMTAKRYSDTYAPFPITFTYDEDDDEFNEEDNANSSKTSKKSKLAGPGTRLYVPPPLDGDDMMTNPMKIMSSPVENLDYIVREIDRLEDEISKNVIGTKGDIRNDAAKNEDQIQDASESRKKKLLGYKDSFNAICSWTFTTLASLKAKKKVVVVVDYGNDFYLKPIDTMYKNLKESKENGSSPVVIRKFQQSVDDYMFKGDEVMMAKIGIVEDIDPAPGKTSAEAVEMYKAGILTIKELDVHVNMNRYVQRYEREIEMPLEINVLGAKNYNAIIQEIFSKFVEEYSTAKEPQIKDDGRNQDD